MSKVQFLFMSHLAPCLELMSVDIHVVPCTLGPVACSPHFIQSRTFYEIRHRIKSMR